MGTTQDVAVLTRKLGASDYDPTKYVAEISQVRIILIIYFFLILIFLFGSVVLVERKCWLRGK